MKALNPNKMFEGGYRVIFVSQGQSDAFNETHVPSVVAPGPYGEKLARTLVMANRRPVPSTGKFGATLDVEIQRQPSPVIFKQAVKRALVV